MSNLSAPYENQTLDALELCKVSKLFFEQPVLNEINLSLKVGEFVSVVGESGTGKTTLLRMSAGLENPSSGSIFFNGKKINGPQLGVGFVFQKPVLLEWRTALENVLLPFQIAGKKLTPEMKEKATVLLERVGLGKALSKLPRELSGGMQSRVALARALILEPSLLLMDEPFAALDAITREKMGELLLQLWEGSRLTVLFVTHDIGEGVYLSDRVVLLAPDPGRLFHDYQIHLSRPRYSEMRFEEPFVGICREIRAAMQHLEAEDSEIKPMERNI